MAQFNNNNQNNNSKSVGSTTYYSGLRIRNYTDNNAISINFSNGLMKVSISKPDENNRFQDVISASLSPKKAAIMVDQIEKLGDSEDGVLGTVLGMGEVQTAIGIQRRDGINYLRIAKVDKTGNITDQGSFTFQTNADPSYRWSDFDHMKFTKSYNNDIDFDMFKNALIDFARNISGAAGYGTLYLNRYQDSSMSNKISAICGKLGINTNTNTNRSYNGGGFFTNNDNGGNNPTSQHRSYDEIASMIDDDDD